MFSSLPPASTASLKLVICFSGKRKSGKDYLCKKLASKLEDQGLRTEIRGVSFPLKEEYVRLHQEKLDIEKLKSDSDYKEKYRKDMADFGERIRNQDSGYFCR